MSKFEGTIEEIIFRNDSNGWTVAAFKPDGSGRISVVGILPFLAAGEHILIDGELSEHQDYGKQIRVNSYESTRPETRSGIEKYLGSGLIKGIGPATAKLIVEHFGREAMDILEKSPERLREISGIGPKRAAMIAESFAINNSMRNTLIYLQNQGLTMAMAMKVYRAYGDQSETVLKRNPYRLADEVDGIGFLTADRIAQSFGFQPYCQERLNSGVRYVLSEAENRSGHMYLPMEELIQSSAEILQVQTDVVEKAVYALILNDFLIVEEVKGHKAVYLPALYRAENETANLLIRILNGNRRKEFTKNKTQILIDEYEKVNKVVLSEKQRSAVTVSVTENVSIITGGPGTGKTTSIKCILDILERNGKIELCAPTGRAAKRMSEATEREARTIHRMLEYSGETESFTKNEDEPIQADAVIVDEVSMVDVFLMRSLLRALKPGTKLILVGDADQLPSVGAGNVLKDMIMSEAVPVVKLDQIFRQGNESQIIVNAHRINHGEYPIIRNRDTDFFLEKRDTPDSILDSVVRLVRDRLPKYLNVDYLRGIQVMCPMKKGALGVIQINETLQQTLNPPRTKFNEINRGDCVFRTGDKIMQVRNNYDLEWDKDAEHGIGVFNGDIGYILSVDPAEREIKVEFDDGRIAVYNDSILNEIELSYCISVHKSQGSEFDAVILPLLNGPRMLLTRNLLYTAVTRAKKLVVIVGREDCVRLMIDNNRITNRYSALDVRMKDMKK